MYFKKITNISILGNINITKSEDTSNRDFSLILLFIRTLLMVIKKSNNGKFTYISYKPFLKIGKPVKTKCC